MIDHLSDSVNGNCEKAIKVRLWYTKNYVTTANHAPSLSIEEKIKALAHTMGFDLVGIANAQDGELQNHIERYEAWLKNNYAASMGYLNRHLDIKSKPNHFVDNARSVVVFGLIYSSADTNLNSSQSKPKVSLYAQGEDYHRLLKDKVGTFVSACSSWGEFQNHKFRTFVDTEPVFERFWGWRAGLGWVGKNTVLINRKKGSYFFIGGFMTDKVLNPDDPHPDHCGKCRKCIDACPTDALLDSKTLDSNKCIAYHTVENKTVVPKDLSKKFDNWIIGCDICQAVCPWNEPLVLTENFNVKNDFALSTISEMVQWTEADYKIKTKNLAISRLKYKMFRRNLYIAISNGSLPSHSKSKLLTALSDVADSVS